jgi:hypothetical protein
MNGVVEGFTMNGVLAGVGAGCIENTFRSSGLILIADWLLSSAASRCSTEVIGALAIVGRMLNEGDGERRCQQSTECAAVRPGKERE